MSDFSVKLLSHAALVEQSLDTILAATPVGNEIARPEQLVSAMRHAALDGGKRLRPFLVLESADLFGVEPDQAIHAACALECIHCYSLVHDDLPAMDNDDLRRGKPTVHKAYNEATAILAGDALLTLAFDILAREETNTDAAIRIELVKLYARNAGLGGMAGGQMFDLEAEGRAELSEAEIITLQAMKTGALIRAACSAGAILGGASQDQIQALDLYGTRIGQAFQLADDILDVTSNVQTLGKQTAKDASRGKGTLVDLYGVDKSRNLANRYLEEAKEALSIFGGKAEILIAAAHYIVERDH